MNRQLLCFPLLAGLLLSSGCMAPTAKPDDPYYAPVLPRTPLPAAQNNGSIYQAGFENGLYDDRKAFRVGDIITLGTSTWQIQEITRDRVIVTPAPGRTARLPFWHGDGSGRDCGFGTAEGAFIRQVCTGLTDAAAE